MYGKVMSISDEMMWRYYELLTDLQVAEIEKMKREEHPMQAKKELARRIVGDFHSGRRRRKRGRIGRDSFKKSEVPEELEEVDGSVLDQSQFQILRTAENSNWAAEDRTSVGCFDCLTCKKRAQLTRTPMLLRIEKLRWS